ncbi:cell wall metabolism sensor histidine kinase VicK [Streptococcus loxodontisalivarius]|uniref:histidine kinase n=1 Tax=Streptococcus loxodontisalivarius TaxID=1349415 RepID=A0ABS2PUD3_9STRE|nr:cell wall metabolism sensor histidine kinase VicK [Streptococcus loxodontisalivarius]MBM7643662.1 two-component system sensor histidine kinase VicK [Streptococcus loxodontisalivarius]
MTNLFISTNLLVGILLLLLVFIFLILIVRDYLTSHYIQKLNKQVKSLMAGDYTESSGVKGSAEMIELASSLNDLSEVFRLTHENLEQEKNRLSGILSYMSDGVLATDRRGNIIMMNAMAQSQLNLSNEEALSLNVMSLLEDTEYTYYDLLTKTPEISLNRLDEFGEFISLRVNFALIKRESGFISGLVAVLHDTTEQDKEERERRLFVSNVSHELRTPLTSVKSYLEALDEGALKEEIAPNFIKVSLDETNRMMRMITDLLALSRIDNASSQLDVELTNFTAFITFILNRFDQMKSQNETDGKTYEIIREYPVVPIWIEIDNDKMTQVIDNIINNAIKYSPDGGRVTVSVRTTDSQLIIAISDEGLGIPKKDLPLIFDRFYRVDKARSRAQGGTGLGLAIAKEIVKQHKGFIWAKSEYGKGSTFTIVLPYEKDLLEEDEWEEGED